MLQLLQLHNICRTLTCEDVLYCVEIKNCVLQKKKNKRDDDSSASDLSKE